LKVTKQYKSWLTELKQNISNVRMQTSLQVNASMLMVYWYIGKQIQQKIDIEDWGAKIIDQLTEDLRLAFPDMSGFSRRNLSYMRRFAAEYPFPEFVQQPVAQIQGKEKRKASDSSQVSKKAIVQQPVAQLENTVMSGALSLEKEFAQQAIAQIPWGHHTVLLDKVSDIDERLWYVNKTIENKWSRNVLLYQISSDLYHRQAKTKKTTNFHQTLPKEQSDLALQILKDPYKFEFLQLSQYATERELETELTNHIQHFLLELGAGFAYVGRQFKLKLGRKEYFLDLLFYHLQLRCFIIIDLKMGEFEPEFAGKMNAYLNVLNKEHKQIHDNPSIGIILCNSKDEIEVEYALQGLQHPIGVSEYKTMHTLPKELRDKLPSVRQLKEAVKEFNTRQKKANKRKSN
jgi:predicted nuclease of restriction endonuclease-like (RecB) superfamily